jgi:demethylmenaquinone methyltransferase/2-methoxy-6-polyprenyl-1,4-benzoquinol methylase/phosphoethanolamine N-methyltransferase
MKTIHSSHAPGAQGHAPHTEGHTIHWARFYDAATWLLMMGKERDVREMTLDLAGLGPRQQVLDVGCGTGSLTIAAQRRVGPTGAVHGLDAAPEMIEVARRKAARAGVEVDFRAGVVEDLPFPDASFDVVLSSLMVHHLPGDDLKRRGFAEMRRVLKPGGRLLVVDFEPPASRLLNALATALLGHSMMQTSVQRYLPMMKEAGFTQVEAGPTRYRALAFVRGGVAGGEGNR